MIQVKLTTMKKMKVLPENFKGIEYVRISSLPGDQREKIWGSFQHDKIIKIVKDQALMNDCILYQDYASWLSQHQPPAAKPAAATAVSSPQQAFANLAFK
jgi:hypothetical protein